MNLLLAATFCAVALTSAPQFHEDHVFPPEKVHNHSATLVETPEGNLLVAWFHGRGEKTDDTLILLGARKEKGAAQWSRPFLLADNPGLPDQNPVLFIDPEGRLYLWWISSLANTRETFLLQYRTATDYEGPGAPKWDWNGNILEQPIGLADAMATMAAVTETLRFYPAVMKVPVRQPLVLAKALSSLAVVSGNRVSLGAGLSPWKEDFTFNGVDFDNRGKLFDECLEIIRAAMSGDYFEYQSDNFSIGRCKLSPSPTAPVPLLIGGHAKPALRRAARLGDGWVSANSDYDTLKELLQTLAEFRREYGTDERTRFEIHAFDVTARSLDDYKRLEALGVTDICVNPWNPYDPEITLGKKLAGIEAFAQGIISRY